MFRYIATFVCLASGLFAQSGTVSVEELRHPLQGKGLKVILAAQVHLRSGLRERGLQELREAMQDPLAMPYAISMLGVEHLKMGQLQTALAEMEQAVRLLPGLPENRSNLAYALFLSGEADRGLQQARKALQLDPTRSKTRLVLGLLLLKQGQHDREAIAHLQAAGEEIPSAHVTLAQYYEKSGRLSDAVRERRAYDVLTASGFVTPK